MTSVDWLQWPAMALTLLASWLVASSLERRREWGFWIFLGSNLLWIVWGVSANAWALATLQIGLLLMNIRGARKNNKPDMRDHHRNGASRSPG